VLYPAILTFCCICAYSINNNPFDVYVTASWRVGYLFYKLDCSRRRLILGFILGPMMEENLAARCCCRARCQRLFHPAAVVSLALLPPGRGAGAAVAAAIKSRREQASATAAEARRAQQRKAGQVPGSSRSGPKRRPSRGGR